MLRLRLAVESSFAIVEMVAAPPIPSKPLSTERRDFSEANAMVNESKRLGSMAATPLLDWDEVVCTRRICCYRVWFEWALVVDPGYLSAFILATIRYMSSFGSDDLRFQIVLADLESSSSGISSASAVASVATATKCESAFRISGLTAIKVMFAEVCV
jgi:hypothetical protein